MYIVIRRHATMGSFLQSVCIKASNDNSFLVVTGTEKSRNKCKRLSGKFKLQNILQNHSLANFFTSCTTIRGLKSH